MCSNPDCHNGTINFQVTQIVYQKETNIFMDFSSNTSKKLLSNCKPVWYTETIKSPFSAGISVPYKFCIKITLKMVPCKLLHFFKTEIKNSACKSLNMCYFTQNSKMIYGLSHLILDKALLISFLF